MSNEFGSSIPYELKYDIERAVKFTKKNNREHSLTFCTLPGKSKIVTSSEARGKFGSTEVKACERKYGKSTKIGDLHTHPTQSRSVLGTTPSEADFTANVVESSQLKRRQTSCITSAGSRYIHCFIPKEVPDKSKVSQYKKALKQPTHHNETSPYFRENIGKDFSHTYYNRSTLKLDKNPNIKDVVNDSFGKSKRGYRLSEIKEVEKGAFCDLMQDYNLPDSNQYSHTCRDELKKRSFIGLFEY